MKLYPILYEGAKTTEEAISSGIVACKIPEGSSSYIVLLSSDRVIDMTPQTSVETTMDVDKLVNEAIVGMIKIEYQAGGLYRERLSAAIDKFGPLTYQIAMFDTPGWLRSDKELSDDALSFWNGMYARSETYERKFLGDLTSKPNVLINALRASSKGVDLLISMGKKKEQIDSTEEKDVERLFNKYNSKLSEFGNMYVYRLKNPDPKVVNMFEKGFELLEGIKQRGYVKVEETLIKAATNFFNRLYK